MAAKYQTTLDQLKVYPVTKQLVKLLADAEGLPIVEFVDSVMRKYAVERGLHTQTAPLIAHWENVEKRRQKLAAAEREKLRQELLEELGHATTKTDRQPE